jgi:hypothetical protein
MKSLIAHNWGHFSEETGENLLSLHGSDLARVSEKRTHTRHLAFSLVLSVTQKDLMLKESICPYRAMHSGSSDALSL